jgi:hypothetical protein
MLPEQKQMLRQGDPRWGRHMIVHPYTIREWGCTITSLCRLHFAINGKRATPLDIAAKLKFTDEGKLIWSSLEAIGLKACRHFRKPTSDELTKHALRNAKPEGGFAKSGMLLELDYAIDHWVALESNSIMGSVLVMDPLKGLIVRKPKKDMMGFAVIQKL